MENGDRALSTESKKTLIAAKIARLNKEAQRLKATATWLLPMLCIDQLNTCDARSFRQLYPLIVASGYTLARANAVPPMGASEFRGIRPAVPGQFRLGGTVQAHRAADGYSDYPELDAMRAVSES